MTSGMSCNGRGKRMTERDKENKAIWLVLKYMRKRVEALEERAIMCESIDAIFEKYTGEETEDE